MFKLDNKHFEVKVKKDQPTGDPQHVHVHHVITHEEIGRSIDKVTSTVVLGLLMYKAGSSLLRMGEHIIVTKVN